MHQCTPGNSGLDERDGVELSAAMIPRTASIIYRPRHVHNAENQTPLTGHSERSVYFYVLLIDNVYGNTELSERSVRTGRSSIFYTCTLTASIDFGLKLKTLALTSPRRGKSMSERSL